MPIYMIEREIPGANKLTDEELRGITATSNDAVAELDKPYTWCYSFVAGDKCYCIHEAQSADDVREHARLGAFPANLVEEITACFDSTGPRELPERTVDLVR